MVKIYIRPHKSKLISGRSAPPSTRNKKSEKFILTSQKTTVYLNRLEKEQHTKNRFTKTQKPTDNQNEHFLNKHLNQKERNTTMSKVQNGTLYYQLYQNKISGAQSYGKYYAKAKHLGTVSFDELIEHMANHNIGFSRGTVNGVMMGFIDCLLELLAQSKKVRIGDLGTFYLNIKSKGANTEADFDTSLITNCGLVFAPSTSKQSNLSRSAFGGAMSYKNFDALSTKKTETETESDSTTQD